MKKKLKLISKLVIMLMIANGSVAFGHSGRTDANGGHKDNKNASGLGSYHYHCGGNPAHLHDNGGCPYNSSAKSSSGNSSSNSNSSNSNSSNNSVKQETVSISNKPAEVKVGENVTLSVSSSTGNTNGEWSSTDDTVAYVKDNVLHTGKPGQATITFKVGAISDSFTITVKEVEVESVIVPTEKLTVQLGKKSNITASVAPDNATNKSIVWSSENDQIVKVVNGVVEAVGVGQTRVVATSANGKTGLVDVEVYKIDPVSIEIESEAIRLELKEKTYKINAKVSPEDANDSDLTYESSDENIVKVDESGELILVGKGKAKITISTSNNVTRVMEVEVYEEGSSVAGAVGLLAVAGAGVAIHKKRKKKRK